MLVKIERTYAGVQITATPHKTKIVNMRGESDVTYARSYDFPLGFTLRPVLRKIKERMILFPGGHL